MAIPPGMTKQEMERLLIVETLRRAGGNIKESAATLGIDRSTLYEKIKKYDSKVGRGERLQYAPIAESTIRPGADT